MKIFSRYTALGAVLLCYSLPLFVVCNGYLLHNQVEQAWQQAAFGLLLSSLGSLALFFIMTRWEAGLVWRYKSGKEAAALVGETLALGQVPTEEFDSLSKAHQKLQTEKLLLGEKIEDLNMEIKRLVEEKERAEEAALKWQNELQICRTKADEELKQQQQFILALQQSIAEQKSANENKLQQIGILENKVSDLTYEIKTLLNIAEAHTAPPLVDPEKVFSGPLPVALASEPISSEEELAFPLNEKQICTAEEASAQLRRCLDIAQKITGSNRFGQMRAFLDSPADSFSIDLRRLCESLRSEQNCAILFYSPKENQLLFANNQIRSLTGWSPEKFVQNFARILVDEATWKNGVASLALRSEVQLNLSCTTRSGGEVQLKAHLGMIPTGIFKYHTLAVLY